MRKAFIIVLAAVLTGMTALSGCGKSAQPDAAADPHPIIKLKVAGFKAGSEIGAIPEINRRFMEENPTIKVSYEGMPGAQFSRYIKGKLAVDDAPDVIMFHPGAEVSAFSESGFIRDLSGEPWLSRFLPSALDSVSSGGKVFGTPNDLVVLGVFYNKDLFAKLSLKMPANWKEFLEVCGQLKANGITPVSIGNNDGWMTLVALFAMGPSMIRDKDFVYKLNKRAVKFNGTWNKMVKQWYDLNDRGYLTPNSTAVSQDQAQKEFMEGRAGMYINGSWALAGILNGSRNFNMGMFAMPANQPGEERVVAAAVGTTWSINSRTEHLEAARKYLAFWSREQTLRDWTQSQASFLTLKGVQSQVPPELDEIAQSFAEHRTEEYISNRWEQSEAAVNELMDSAQGVYLKALTVNEMLDNMDHSWDSSMAKGGESP